MPPDNPYPPTNPAFDPSLAPQPHQPQQAQQPNPAWSPPLPPVLQEPKPTLGNPDPTLPVPVVKVLSVHGLEYAMMTIALWVSAATMTWGLLNLINSGASFDFLIAPASALITTLPIFGLLFIRLRRAEIAEPKLRADPSKRRWSQTTQLLAFISCLINLIVFVYYILEKIGGDSKASLPKSVGNLLVVLVIAGGVLVYYWFDEHRSKG